MGAIDRLNDKEIQKLLTLETVEDLYFLLTITEEDQIKNFLERYKNAQIEKSPDPKIDTFIKKASTPVELLREIKKVIVEKLNDDLKKAKSSVSSIRKKGGDGLITDFKINQAALKIRMYSASGKKEDFYRVKKIFEEIKKELEPKKSPIN